ncbi:MAG: aldehyde dehydrogenase EutE [Dehalococcoidia bacterium]|nr:aldehyde dehydrogenase EutE [Dehalococcoidia bacterium]
MNFTDQQINSIVDKVIGQLSDVKKEEQVKKPLSAKPHPEFTYPQSSGKLGCFLDIEAAIEASRKAFEEYKSVSIKQRKKIIEAVRRVCLENVDELSKLAVEETGLGRYDDKINKNILAIEKTPGVEDLEPFTYTGDDGLTLLERAPFGVIGSVTPCTNPSETIINNGIGMIAGGNSVVFNPHPLAKKVSALTVSLINKAIISEGGPPNLLTTVTTPTIESAQRLMVHPKIRLLVVTGGPHVVNQAMKSGKRVIAAGPGNPPVVVDETADLEKAGRDIVLSASCDNNIICVVEKEIIVTHSAAEGLKKSLIKHGGVELSPYQTRRLEKVILTEKRKANKNWVGKDVQLILKEIGMDVDPSKRLAFMETKADHPFAVEELLMPVVPLIRVKDIDEAIDLAYELEKNCFHTAVIHSKNIDNMHKMAVKMNCSIFVKNGPGLAGLAMGGEGPTTFTIASPTGEGNTTARHFTRTRRCVLSGHFRIT